MLARRCEGLVLTRSVRCRALRWRRKLWSRPPSSSTRRALRAKPTGRSLPNCLHPRPIAHFYPLQITQTLAQTQIKLDTASAESQTLKAKLDTASAESQTLKAKLDKASQPDISVSAPASTPAPAPALATVMVAEPTAVRPSMETATSTEVTQQLEVATQTIADLQASRSGGGGGGTCARTSMPALARTSYNHHRPRSRANQA